MNQSYIDESLENDGDGNWSPGLLHLDELGGGGNEAGVVDQQRQQQRPQHGQDESMSEKIEGEDDNHATMDKDHGDSGNIHHNLTQPRNAADNAATAATSQQHRQQHQYQKQGQHHHHHQQGQHRHSQPLQRPQPQHSHHQYNSSSANQHINSSSSGNNSNSQMINVGQQQQQRIHSDNNGNGGDGNGSAANGGRVSRNEINTIQKTIERHLTMYMTKEQVIEALRNQYDPNIIELVWSNLEGQNAEFFRAYGIRTQIKQQIELFNQLVAEQIALMQQQEKGNGGAPVSGMNQSYRLQQTGLPGVISPTLMQQQQRMAQGNNAAPKNRATASPFGAQVLHPPQFNAQRAALQSPNTVVFPKQQLQQHPGSFPIKSPSGTPTFGPQSSAPQSNFQKHPHQNMQQQQILNQQRNSTFQDRASTPNDPAQNGQQQQQQQHYQQQYLRQQSQQQQQQQQYNNTHR